MKRKNRVLAFILVLTLLVGAVPVNAAVRTNMKYDSVFSVVKQWVSRIEEMLDNFSNPNSEDGETAEAITGAAENAVAENKTTAIETETANEETTAESTIGTAIQAGNTDSSDGDANFSDTESVSRGYSLSAKTSNVSEDGEEAGTDTTEDDGEAVVSETTVLKYFPVTLYDYTQATINNATHDAEILAANANDETLTQWNGIYFNGGMPSGESYNYGAEKVTPEYTDGKAVIEDGKYLLIHRRSGKALVGATTGITGTTSWTEATVWDIEKYGTDAGVYTIKSGEYYMMIGENTGNCKIQETEAKVVLTDYSTDASDTATVMLKGSSVDQYLNQYGGSSSNDFGGYNDSADAGSVFYLYKVADADSVKTISTLEYAEWNHWNKASGNNDNGQKMYTGLVESRLDTNKDIVFTKPEGGIFNSDAAVKSIYPGVEMPFVYSEDGYYTFDASQNGVYLYADKNQKSTDTAKVTLDDNGTSVTPRLYFNERNPQTNGGDYGDGSATVWMPFNNTTAIGSEAACNYHFGMRATIPFSMTSNGCVVETDDDSAPITFSFSGDDDVWVFIDGQLVIDLGGIHNRLDATIDFEANTVTYSESNNSDAATGSYNDSTFELKQTLFENLITQDRTSFASTDTHELTIFYLERGMGSSNCKIAFNLPVEDTLTVTKEATKSYSSATDEVTPLTETEQANVNNISFGFTLYQSTDNGATYTTVANTKYYLINANGQQVSNRATDENGKFYLKNGESARFITTLMDNKDGVVYKVTEDAVNGFTEPDYNYSGTAVNFKTAKYDTKSNLSWEDYGTKASAIPELVCSGGSTTSDEVKVTGSSQSDDSLQIICSNFVDAELPNPSARPVDDKIVLDYGLPVEIDVLSNDLYRGDKIELVSVVGTVASDDEMEDAQPVYGTAEIKDGKILYTLNKPLTGVEVLSYRVKVSSNAEGTKPEYATAVVYIMPATIMYYEENFSNMVTFTNGKSSGWTAVGTPETDCQEPGVVGILTESPYGSDAAYLNDSTDSNGSSMYVDTTNGAAKFSYQFTGTGTSFFARTTNNSAYMKVTITDSNNKVVYTGYRDTSYKTETDTTTLYNIPVFTYNAVEYGTYTVTVSIAGGANAGNYGREFWLDGIRVFNPLNEKDANAAMVKSAYVTDEEAYMTNETLRLKMLKDSTSFDEDQNLIWDGTNFVVFTDTNGTIQSASEYESNGPKEEVYLNQGQTVSFALTKWNTNENRVYLGIKAPFGTGSVTINGNTLSINNAADCYYDITNYASVTTGSDGVMTASFNVTAASSLISVTNIKVSGDAKFTIIQGKNINVKGYVGSGTDTE